MGFYAERTRFDRFRRLQSELSKRKGQATRKWQREKFACLRFELRTASLDSLPQADYWKAEFAKIEMALELSKVEERDTFWEDESYCRFQVPLLCASDTVCLFLCLRRIG